MLFYHPGVLAANLLILEDFQVNFCLFLKQRSILKNYLLVFLSWSRIFFSISASVRVSRKGLQISASLWFLENIDNTQNQV